MFAVEFRDLDEGERVLFETGSPIEYAWVLFTLATFPERFETVKADVLSVPEEPRVTPSSVNTLARVRRVFA